MITGLGIDIIEVERMATKIGKDQGFREMVFSQKEVDYCETKASKYEHYAARFAAKEAFFKALGTGWRGATAFHEVEINNDENGKPFVVLLGETAQTLSYLDVQKIHVSLSHIKTMATAIIIIEQ